MSLARLIVRRRGIIAGCWVLAAISVGPRGARIEQVLDVSAAVPSSESAEVERLLSKQFDSPFAHYAVLVVTGLPSPTIVPGQTALGELADSISVAPGVTRVLSYLDAHDSLFLAARGSAATFLVVGLDAKTGPLDVLIPPLRRASDAIARRMRAGHPNIALEWTGEVALNYDLRRTSAEDARRAELRALPLTLVLLGIAFGSIVAALLPAGAGALAIVATLGVASLVATRMPLSILLENVVSMLGLGLGIDYALLIVSRFREEMSAGLSADDAAEAAARFAGHTVMVSGIAVAVGFAALLVVPLNELRAIAVGGLLVSLFSVLVATTLLPGVLAWLGARADAGRLLRRGSKPVVIGDSRWFRWGAFVARHPRMLVVLLGAPVVALAMQSRRLSTELPRGDWLPPKMESARGLATLRALGRGGVLQTIRVVIELPPNAPALGADGWRATRAFTDAFAHDERVAAARSLPSLAADAAGSDSAARSAASEPDSAVLASLPPDVRRSFASDDGRYALVELVPRENAEPEALSRLVAELRAPAAAARGGLAGVRLHVGGLPAFNVDYRDAINRQMPLVVGLVIGGTFLALLIAFRSVLIPLKAVALNLLTVGAAVGALTLVFQEGHGAWIVGLHGGVHSVFPAIPVLVFCTVFGLSMDYEVFLVARVAESRRRGRSESESLADGLGGTGGVITSAAMIMVVVFGAFTMGEFLLVKMLGFTLAVAVVLDATVVRMAVGPALLRLAGRWNWWPGDRRVGAATPMDLPAIPEPTR